MEENIFVGRFSVVSILGKGKRGFVYLAKDPAAGEPVVLKAVRPEGEDPEPAMESLRKTSRKLAAAGTSAVVPFREVFEDAGTVYLMREHVPGTTLTDILSAPGGLSAKSWRAMARQLLRATAAVHRKGLVHGNLTGENCIVEDGGRLRVLDLGLSLYAGTSEGTGTGPSPSDDVKAAAGLLRELLQKVSGEPEALKAGGALLDGVIRGTAAPHPLTAEELLEALTGDPDRTVSLEASGMTVEPPPPETPQAPQKVTQPPLPPPPPRTAFTQPAEVLPPPPEREEAPRNRKRMSKGLWITVLLIVVLGTLGGVLLVKYRDAILNRPKEEPTPPPPPKREEVMPVPVKVITEPSGAQLFLDGKPVDQVVLDVKDSREHLVEARQGCLAAGTKIKNGGSKEIRLVLKPSPWKLNVTSDPPGAAISLNGRNTRKITPAAFQRTSCGKVKVRLEMKGRLPYETELNPKEATEVRAELAKRPPKGSVRISKGRWALRIYLKDKFLGRPGDSIPMEAGDHTLRFFAPAIRGNLEKKVKVRSGRETTVTPPTFRTGQVFLFGEEGKVYVDGVYLDEIPLTGVPIAVGRHRFTVSFADGDRVETFWRIREGTQRKVVRAETGRFEDR